MTEQLVELENETRFEDTLAALEQDELTTTAEVVDLTTAQYDRDSDFGSLSFRDRGGKVVLTEWSARQLCKLAGLPFGVWRKASGQLAQDMFGEFMPLVKEPNRKLVLKSFGASKTVARGVLPIDYPDVRNSELLKAMGKLSSNFVIASAAWMEESNASFFRTRFVLKDTMFQTSDNEALFLGVDLTSSELGAGPLQISLLLYRPICKNGASILYGNKPYFYFNYSTALAMDVSDLVKTALTRLTGDLDKVMDAVEVSKKQTITKAESAQLLDKMMKDGLINKGLLIKTLVELEEKGVNTKWDLVQGITAVARGYRDQLRMRYENAGGLLLGLNLQRGHEDEGFATQVAALPALPAV